MLDSQMLTGGDVVVVRAECRVLDGAWIRQLEARFGKALESESMCVLDASEVEDITPQALAALIELGARYPRPSLCLAGLRRPALLLAVQVGLAERFGVYTSVAAARGDCAPGTRMRAVIWELPGSVGVGALDVAGRPLLIRQLQFLRDVGIEDVVVEIAEGPDAAERAALLLGPDPLCTNVCVIPSASPLGLEELAGRAGIPHDELILSLPADLALHASLDLQVKEPTSFELDSPSGLHESSVRVDVRTRRNGPSESLVRKAPGWAARIRHHEAAHALGCAILLGHAPGLMIHAAQVRPGVWLARGARVAHDAQLVPPVLIGGEARVFAKAQVGPRAIVGHASVVEREAVISESSIAKATIVGEGARIHGAHAEPHGMISFADLSYVPVDDALVLTCREPPATAWSSRALALLLCVLLVLPWLLGTLVRRALGRPSVRALQTRWGDLHVGQSGMSLVDLFPPLLDVVLGRRDLVGINDPEALEKACTQDHEYLRPGAFDLSRALAPGASTATLMRMWRWYRAHKSRALDRALWRQRAHRDTRDLPVVSKTYADG
jgi:hypothetical protein